MNQSWNLNTHWLIATFFCLHDHMDKLKQNGAHLVTWFVLYRDLSIAICTDTCGGHIMTPLASNTSLGNDGSIVDKFTYCVG